MLQFIETELIPKVNDPQHTKNELTVNVQKLHQIEQCRISVDDSLKHVNELLTKQILIIKDQFTLNNLCKTEALAQTLKLQYECKNVFTPKMKMNRFIELFFANEYTKRLKSGIYKHLEQECTVEFKHYGTRKKMMHEALSDIQIGEMISEIATTQADALYKNYKLSKPSECINFLCGWIILLINLKCISEDDPEIIANGWITKNGVGNSEILLIQLRVVVKNLILMFYDNRVKAFLNVLLLVVENLNNTILCIALNYTRPENSADIISMLRAPVMEKRNLLNKIIKELCKI